MEIYPEDLGPSHCRQVLEDRLLYVGGGATRASVPSVSLSGRVQERARPGRASVWPFIGLSLIAAWIITGIFHSSFWIVFILCTVIALIWRQRHEMRADLMAPTQRASAEPRTSAYARLDEPEITRLQNALLQKGNDDPLLGMYLDLVWAAMHLDPLAAGQAETERNAREAIRALGGAIETLPPRTLDGASDSHAKLQAAAARMEAEAPLEADPVIAASLVRRAEALRGQAETLARVKVLLRRNEALREELADQIGALRTSLAATALGGDDSGPELAGLAARIRRVASEANAVTAARVEVDTLFSHARANVPVSEEEVRQQRVGLNGEAL